MTPALALPGDTFIAWMAIIACGGLIIRDRIIVALAWLDRKNAETDAVIADLGMRTDGDVAIAAKCRELMGAAS